MSKISSIIIGEDPKVTQGYQPESKRKIALYATCMMVPVLLWFFNGFFLVGKIMEGSIGQAILTGIVVSTIVFLIERSIILSNGHPVIGAARIIMGVAIAFVGSICLDEVIFEQDIDNQVETYRQEFIERAGTTRIAKFDLDLLKQQQAVADQRVKWQEANAEAVGEADGTRGSGAANRGPITQMKEGIASQYKMQLDRETSKLESMEAGMHSFREAAETEAEANFNPNGLLIRVRAMFDLVKTNKAMMWFYIAFTVLLFMTEFLVVLAKFFSKETIDEKLEKRRNELLDEKSRRLLEKMRNYYRPELELPEVQRAERLTEQIPATLYV